jgi:hypothetical protein
MVPGRKGVSRADKKPRAVLHAQAGAGVQAVPGVTYDIPMKLDRNMQPLQPDLVPSGRGPWWMGHLDLRGAGQGDPRDIKPPANVPPFPTETLPRTEGQAWSRGQPARFRLRFSDMMRSCNFIAVPLLAHAESAHQVLVSWSASFSGVR